MEALRFTQFVWRGRRDRAPSWPEIQFPQAHHEVAGALAKRAGGEAARGAFADGVSFVVRA
jgi:hypothetical protein